MSRILFSVLLISFLSSNCLGQQIKYTDCTESDPKGYCKINDVRISPCKEAGSSKPCILKKGKSYSIQMDLTALKPMETINSLPYWASETDLPFAGMNENACSFMQCPVAEGTVQTYNFDLKIAKYLPRGSFDVKWKFSADNVTENGCCARFYLKLM